MHLAGGHAPLQPPVPTFLLFRRNQRSASSLCSVLSLWLSRCVYLPVEVPAVTSCDEDVVKVEVVLVSGLDAHPAVGLLLRDRSRLMLQTSAVPMLDFLHPPHGWGSAGRPSCHRRPPRTRCSPAPCLRAPLHLLLLRTRSDGTTGAGGGFHQEAPLKISQQYSR